ncbi:MAG: hypothetical protein JXX14_20225, partial [Deltaproteobacteria bacterium]|nr:hypothetical protein [Deltaproteobacteria bacterium]
LKVCSLIAVCNIAKVNRIAERMFTGGRAENNRRGCAANKGKLCFLLKFKTSCILQGCRMNHFNW